MINCKEKPGHGNNVRRGYVLIEIYVIILVHKKQMNILKTINLSTHKMKVNSKRNPHLLGESIFVSQNLTGKVGLKA